MNLFNHSRPKISIPVQKLIVPNMPIVIWSSKWDFKIFIYNIRNIHRVFKVVAILQLSFKPPEIILSLVKMARRPKPFNAPIVNNLPDGPS